MPSIEDYLGSIGTVGFLYPMRGFALADGSVMSVQQNSALFSLFGTFFGGDGVTTFGLPDLRGRVAVGQGQGPGMSDRIIGEEYGTEAVTLLTANLPPHEHPVSLGGSGAADSTGGPAVQGTTAGSGGQTAQSGVVGQGQPVPITPPALVLTYLVSLYGPFPIRD